MYCVHFVNILYDDSFLHFSGCKKSFASLCTRIRRRNLKNGKALYQNFDNIITSDASSGVFLGFKKGL